MISFARLPIRQKILAITMLISTSALLLATAVFVAYDLIQARAELQTATGQLTLVLAYNTAAAIAFDDPAAARDTLASLRAQPTLAVACVYKTSTIFASYVSHPDLSCPVTDPLEGVVFGRSVLSVTSPIILDGKRTGAVHVQISLAPLYSRIEDELVAVGGIVVIAGLFAFWLSERLQRLISDPILSLAETAKRVSDRKDYGIRAIRQTQDELGLLVTSFNDMLEQIQERDRNLLDANEKLEERVTQRTAELARRNEELNRSNKDLDDFAYIASHDLKEPLRGIHNYSCFLIEDYANKLGDDGRGRLETLIRLSKLMEKIIDSLLEYSRVGRSELSIRHVDVHSVLNEVLESLHIVLNESGVGVTVRGPLPPAPCDPALLGEIFRNLVTNAMKYNDRPAKYIEIGFNTGGTTPAYYVKDNGIGIAPKHQQAVFRIFKRLHGRDKYGGGTGAGLTIVKKIVERHGGAVWLESVAGEGTTFFFTLNE